MTWTSLLRWSTAGALALTACNGTKSLGELDTDEGSGGDGSGSGSASDSASASSTVSASGTSAGTGSGGETASDSDATADGATATDDADTGTPGQCDGENDCVLYPIDCDDVQCGGTSMFDDDGCVRTACTTDPTVCDADAPCYRAMDFGGCQSSAVGCVDDELEMICQCATLPDCGGAFCLPLEEWPSPDEGPGGDAVVRDTCAPNDGPAFELQVGLDGTSCDATAQPDQPFVSIRIDAAGPAPGTFHFGELAGGQGDYDAGDGNVLTNGNGWIVIDAFDGETVSGSYHLVVPEVAYLSGTFEAPYCEGGGPCG